MPEIFEVGDSVIYRGEPLRVSGQLLKTDTVGVVTDVGERVQVRFPHGYGRVRVGAAQLQHSLKACVVQGMFSIDVTTLAGSAFTIDGLTSDVPVHLLLNRVEHDLAAPRGHVRLTLGTTLLNEFGEMRLSQAGITSGTALSAMISSSPAARAALDRWRMRRLRQEQKAPRTWMAQEQDDDDGAEHKRQLALSELLFSSSPSDVITGFAELCVFIDSFDSDTDPRISGEGDYWKVFGMTALRVILDAGYFPVIVESLSSPVEACVAEAVRLMGVLCNLDGLDNVDDGARWRSDVLCSIEAFSNVGALSALVGIFRREQPLPVLRDICSAMRLICRGGEKYQRMFLDLGVVRMAPDVYRGLPHTECMAEFLIQFSLTTPSPAFAELSPVLGVLPWLFWGSSRADMALKVIGHFVKSFMRSHPSELLPYCYLDEFARLVCQKHQPASAPESCTEACELAADIVECGDFPCQYVSERCPSLIFAMLRTLGFRAVAKAMKRPAHRFLLRIARASQLQRLLDIGFLGQDLRALIISGSAARKDREFVWNLLRSLIQDCSEHQTRQVGSWLKSVLKKADPISRDMPVDLRVALIR